MGSHPINLAVRFFLELAGLGALGWWGWSQNAGFWRYALALGIPVLATAVWGIFAVPDDPSRSGRAPVQVSGLLRLLLELAFFAAATLALIGSGLPSLATGLGTGVLLHYLISYDRVNWLIRQ